MGVNKERIEGTKIYNEINSTNITKTEYDTETKELVVEFKTGAKYQYEEVPHTVYTRFRLSESQGKYFSQNISKKYKYKKI